MLKSNYANQWHVIDLLSPLHHTWSGSVCPFAPISFHGPITRSRSKHFASTKRKKKNTNKRNKTRAAYLNGNNTAKTSSGVLRIRIKVTVSRCRTDRDMGLHVKTLQPSKWKQKENFSSPCFYSGRRRNAKERNAKRLVFILTAIVLYLMDSRLNEKRKEDPRKMFGIYLIWRGGERKRVATFTR